MSISESLAVYGWVLAIRDRTTTRMASAARNIFKLGWVGLIARVTASTVTTTYGAPISNMTYTDTLKAGSAVAIHKELRESDARV